MYGFCNLCLVCACSFRTHVCTHIHTHTTIGVASTSWLGGPDNGKDTIKAGIESMLNYGGLGACPTRKILLCSKIKFQSIFRSKTCLKHSSSSFLLMHTTYFDVQVVYSISQNIRL